MSLLEVEDLDVVYDADPDVHAVRDVSFSIEEGENVGLVGESGCGKSTVAKAIMGALPDNGRITNGEIRFDGEDLVGLSPGAMRQKRWDDLAMISQSAMNSLDPVYTIGNQIREAIDAHRDVTKAEARERARELLEIVGIDADHVDSYPHQLSGGMRQRAIIAMALALNPRLIVADEPTTALDVIIQEQVLHRIRRLQREFGSSMLMITHDISVVAATCDKVVVMYGGEVMEAGTTEEIFNDAKHPYTLGLQNAFPSVAGEKKDLISIPGSPPDLSSPPRGCPFESRCPFSTAACGEPLPEIETEDGHRVRCHEPVPFDEMREESTRRELWQSQRA